MNHPYPIGSKVRLSSGLAGLVTNVKKGRYLVDYGGSVPAWYKFNDVTFISFHTRRRTIEALTWLVIAVCVVLACVPLKLAADYTPAWLLLYLVPVALTPPILDYRDARRRRARDKPETF